MFGGCVCRDIFKSRKSGEVKLQKEKIKYS